MKTVFISLGRLSFLLFQGFILTVTYDLLKVSFVSEDIIEAVSFSHFVKKIVEPTIKSSVADPFHFDMDPNPT